MLSIKVKDAILTDSTNTILISIQLLKENPHMDYFQTEKTTETRQQRQQKKRPVRNSIICTLSLSYQPNFVMSLLIGWLSSWFQNEPITPELKKEIESNINSHKVLVYSKSYCPYCTSTKTLLQSLNQDYKVIELDQIPKGSAIQNGLQELTGQRTVPNVFINGKHIGGNSDIQALHSQGKLKPLFV